MTMNADNNVTSLYHAVRRIITLYIENAKLTAAEKITHLMGAMAIVLTCMLFGLVGFVFAVIGLATWLQDYIEPFWTYFIVTGAFVLIILILVLFRKWLVYNPLAKFLTRVFMETPN